MNNQLYYGDNLDIMRKNIADESVDLCYIDPPYNSDRTYNQIYNNIGEDKAQSTAFVDTWVWNTLAQKEYDEICMNACGRITPRVAKLIMGLYEILGRGSLMSYIVSMTLRIDQIHRVLKPTGSFYLHCDPTASHYLKLVLDAVFCGRGGDFKNEIIWSYKTTVKVHKSHFGRDHDIVFFYTKGKESTFHPDRSDFPISEKTLKRWGKYADKTGFVSNVHRKNYKMVDTSDETKGFYINHGMPRDVWDISVITGGNKENQGYKTQKPEALLERIIKSSSNEGDIVLDAFCGCGTTVAVAQKLNRQWIGIDISYNSITVIEKRLTEKYGKDIADSFDVRGIPRDVESARRLAEKTKDDRLRKEFEKWAILTYSDNKAMVNDIKGKDGGYDGRINIPDNIDGNNEFRAGLFSVKSGKVGVTMIREFCRVVERENAAVGFFITLEEPSKGMVEEAAAFGIYTNAYAGDVPRMKIVTIKEVMGGERLTLPAADVYKTAKAAEKQDGQLKLE
ncbi:MAG: hypothetical protein FWG45_03780 [Oscillospiraceae bacterium]|nr:hypothetical protein [Oscillospiraceae bacterium]